jgi:hypothetical protein
VCGFRPLVNREPMLEAEQGGLRDDARHGQPGAQGMAQHFPAQGGTGEWLACSLDPGH